jgi:hypothetical protein
MSKSAYEITRLAFADIVRYRQILDEISAERKYRRMSYEPARRAIVEYHQSDGDTTILADAILAQRQVEREAEPGEATTQPRNNAEVLEGYLSYFASPFRAVAVSVPDEFESYKYTVHGLTITAKPHLAVRNGRGNIKYLYLLTSKDWGEQQKGFFLSLLSEIIASNINGTQPRDIEGLDCRSGHKIIRLGLGRNFRQRVEFIAEDLIQRGLA